jgi:hypothetical protein
MLAPMLRALAWILVAVLLVGAVYELALALGAGSGSARAGNDVDGASSILVAAYLGMPVGAIVAGIDAVGPASAAGVALLAPAAAAFLLAFFFTYDPYYAPVLERNSERDVVSLAWVPLLALAAGSVGVLARIRPPGAAATVVTLLVLLPTTFAVADSH